MNWIPVEQNTHALHYGWVFWFMHRSPGERITDYEAAMKKVATFNTVRDKQTSTQMSTNYDCVG